MADPVYVYIVYGSQGEHDDHETWEICAYITQGRAHEHVLALYEAFQSRDMKRRLALDPSNGARWYYDVSFGVQRLQLCARMEDLVTRPMDYIKPKGNGINSTPEGVANALQ